jgi:hypothetical protein
MAWLCVRNLVLLFREAESFHRRRTGSVIGHKVRRWHGMRGIDNEQMWHDGGKALIERLPSWTHFWSGGMGPGREVQAHSFPIGGQSDQEFVAAGPHFDGRQLFYQNARCRRK